MILDQSRYSAHVRADADRLATCLERAPHGTAIESCPGWDLRKLALHTGMVHRWATHAIEHGESSNAPDPTVDDWASWMREGAARLADAIDAAEPDAATWHPFPVEQHQWVWARRQAQETAMHRWDAEVATVGSSTLDPVLASDGVGEYFDLMVPRLVVREGAVVPSASLHVHCTDVDGEWLVWSDDGGYHVVCEHRKGDAALRGPAESLLLVLLGRRDRSELDIVGDAAAADAWLDLPGW